MSITDTIKKYIGAGGESVEVREFRCADCGHTFDSAKSAERAQCMECLSNDVELTS